MTAFDHFPPTRDAAVERLDAFLPHAGEDYAERRNYDLGPGNHDGVSQLSPYIRHRVLTEAEVLRAVTDRFSPSTAEKFVQEVFWRTYWKGWLEMRPSVWMQYQSDLRRRLDAVQTQSGLRDRWEAACKGDTGIAAADHWAHELVETGYLHNHARMWFASIWIFTLELPWELGADFFLRHLLDGDPASNTLNWRWVAGVQTKGKTYQAHASNIEKYTKGRFNPEGELADDAPARDSDPHPPVTALPETGTVDRKKRTLFILHPEDLSPDFALKQVPEPIATVSLIADRGLSPLDVAPHVIEFQQAAVRDAADRYGLSMAQHFDAAEALADWAASQGVEQIVTAYAPVGPTASAMSAIANTLDVPLVQARRDYDSAAWPHATHGFFKFKKKIPELLKTL